jgi:hypothetical protein
MSAAPGVERRSNDSVCEKSAKTFRPFGSAPGRGLAGLRRLEARTRKAGSRGLKHGELAADRRRGRQLGDHGEHPEHSSRRTLERIVRACATASRDESEFIRRLGDEGVRYRPRYAEGGTDVVVGYSVRLPGADVGSRRSVWYGGGRLARNLTLPALRRSWGQDEDAWQRAVTEWSMSTSVRLRSQEERQAELAQRGLMWHRCTAELERVRQQLQAAGNSAAAIAHAAREGAGVLAAWSVALEGEQPGAVARATRQLARSAELPACTPPPRKAVSRASGLALFMLAAGKLDSAVGWTIVGREIGLLASELGRVHRACGELDRAQQIESELAAELARINMALEHEQPRTGEVPDAEARPRSALASRCRLRPGILDGRGRGRPRTSSGCSARCSGRGSRRTLGTSMRPRLATLARGNPRPDTVRGTDPRTGPGRRPGRTRPKPTPPHRQ